MKWWWFAAGAVALVGALFLSALFAWPSISLTPSSDALARLDLPHFAGDIQQLDVRNAQGVDIPVSRRHGELWPERTLDAGATVSVSVTVRHPSWIGWLVGKSAHKTFTVTTPVTHVSGHWLQVPDGQAVRVPFDSPVGVVAIDGQRNVLASATTRVKISAAKPIGSVLIAGAARTWERLTNPARVSWFPARKYPQVLAEPPTTASLRPGAQLTLTFSTPVSSVLGADELPQLKPAVAGRWVSRDAHTLVFRPAGLGFGLGATVRVVLPRAVHVVGAAAATKTVVWHVPAGSTLRLNQLLALLGYLPLDWTAAAGSSAMLSVQQEFAAAVSPPDGVFSWRYPNMPAPLTALWSPADANQITRGAVMMFEDDHNLPTDGVAGPAVWRALFTAVQNDDVKTDGYSYVFVHRNVPQSMNLWHNGKVILKSPGNTGIPSAPTQLGTFPVFEHIPSGTMSGTNPDGSHYNDPGVRYISYFNGGDALHAFPRASYGTPQSLGCVELPLDAAAAVWPYTPIGTLVTIEN
ncbi:MAG TPA: L,D-transpeptidase family protein [Gaiellaceae bacterium]